MLDKEIVRKLGETIDRLITTDILARGAIGCIYQSARKDSNDEPLTFKAAEGLSNVIEKGDTVFITTGCTYPDLNVGETDGPIGTASLARALCISLGAKPIIIVEKMYENMMLHTLRGIGLNVLPFESAQKYERVATIVEFPKGKEKERSKELIEEFKPKAVISIERIGKNRKGIYHNMAGLDISECTAEIDVLIEEAKNQKILTVGIGDGGNEIGMGKVIKTVRKEVAYGERCQCPCKGGIACVTETDILVAASVSNWGAHGIAAVLAGKNKNMDILHDRAYEIRAMRECVDAGGVGMNGSPYPGLFCDDLPDTLHAQLVEFLRYSVKGALTRKYKG